MSVSFLASVPSQNCTPVALSAARAIQLRSELGRARGLCLTSSSGENLLPVMGSVCLRVAATTVSDVILCRGITTESDVIGREILLPVMGSVWLRDG